MKCIINSAKFFLIAFIVAICVSSCVVRANSGRGVWIRGHYEEAPSYYHHRHWVRGHWS